MYSDFSEEEEDTNLTDIIRTRSRHLLLNKIQTSVEATQTDFEVGQLKQSRLVSGSLYTSGNFYMKIY